MSLAKLHPLLKDQVGDVYCYVVASVSYRNGHFCHDGTGPNWQGGRITLCLCKHQMRSHLTVDRWPGQWVAGFTGRSRVTKDGGNYLVYLMKVGEAYESHRDLWLSLEGMKETQPTVEAKAAHHNVFGDVFRPVDIVGDPFRPAAYEDPIEGHKHNGLKAPTAWHKDIDYVGTNGKRPALLVGEVTRSFVWNKPSISLKHWLPRDYTKCSVGDLLPQLEEGAWVAA